MVERKSCGMRATENAAGRSERYAIYMRDYGGPVGFRMALTHPERVDLFYDYRTNVTAYPAWLQWTHKTQPRLLVLWGKYDLSFDIPQPEAHRRDVPSAEVHTLEAGHFALDTAADEIAALVRSFMGSTR
jgi:pimeloyl-ACP methyl ester carboxylesterase